MTERVPKASRPALDGYGIAGANEGEGLLPWSWARERLEKARTYFLATITHAEAGDRPHLMPVWGVWIDDTFQLSTDGASRKGRNLAANPRCSICPDDGAEAILVEGAAAELTDLGARARMIVAYKAKYDSDPTAIPSTLYVIRPRLVFGFVEKTFTKSATRWIFDD
jgi:hypothetical protein